MCEGKCGSLVLAFLIFLLEILVCSSWKYNFFFFSQGCYFALSKFTIRSKPGRYYCVLPGNKCNNPVFTFTISLISKDVFCYSVNMFCYFTDSISYSKAYFFFFFKGILMYFIARMPSSWAWRSVCVSSLKRGCKSKTKPRVSQDVTQDGRPGNYSVKNTPLKRMKKKKEKS